MKNKRIGYILITIVGILCVPLIAMQFTAEVSWNISDFIVAGILLLITGILIEVVARNVKKRSTQIYLILGFLVLLFLIWAELAVGIFGTPFAGS